jgi:DHA3 family macrolide efflux protein-like MFS transporter
MELGWMNACWSAGLIAGGLLLGPWGGLRRRVLTMLVGTKGFGAGLLIVGLSPASHLPLALAGMVIAATCLSLANGAVFALLQQAMDAGMQGRVFTIIVSLSNALAPLS